MGSADSDSTGDNGGRDNDSTASQENTNGQHNIDLAELFHPHRFAHDWRFLLFILYFPLGIVLTVVRLFLLLHLVIISSVIPKSFHTFRSFVLRFLAAPIGTVITITGREHIEAECKIVVSNRVTVLDRFVVNLIIPNITVSSQHESALYDWLLGRRYIDKKLDKADYLKTLKEIAQSNPYTVFLQPEPMQTSGNVGMLKFSTSPTFDLDLPIQPIVIQTHRAPVGYVACSTMESSYWSDIFWSLFTPTTHYSLSILPVMTRGDTVRQPTEFCDEVRRVMCAAVSPPLRATPHDMEDVKRYMIQREQERREREMSEGRRRRRQGDSSGGEREQMVTRVREILPTVPADVIRADLGRTRSVNSTVSRLLDGTVAYIPVEPPPPPATPRHTTSHTSCTSSSSSSITTAGSTSHGSLHLPTSTPPAPPTAARASTFSTNPADRARSFAERKAALVRECRERYLARHGTSGGGETA